MAVGVKVVTDAEAPPEVQQLFAAVQQKMGQVPKTLRAMANHPAYLKLVLEKMNLLLWSGKLDQKAKLLVALAVSTLNGCESCIKLYTDLLKRMGTTDEELVELMGVIDLVGGLNHFNNGLRIHPED